MSNSHPSATSNKQKQGHCVLSSLTGCGSLPYVNNQQSWNVHWLDGDVGTWDSDTSIVYHMYGIVCKPNHTLIGNPIYRCNENRKWNYTHNLTVSCVPKDGKSITIKCNDFSYFWYWMKMIFNVLYENW